MNDLRRRFLLAAVSVAFACCTISSLPAQTPSAPPAFVKLFAGMMQLEGVGKYAEAVALVPQVLAGAEQGLSHDDPRYMNVLYEVGNLYRITSRADDAIAMFKRVLAIEEKALGPDHIGVGQTLVALGVVYSDDGRFADAEAAYKRALAVAEKSGSQEHVAIVLNGLADVYQGQGRYADAIPLAERALAYMSKAVSPDNTELATEMDNLAVYYHHENRDAEAEPLYKRALAIRTKAMRRRGATAVDGLYLGVATEYLATFYRDRGRYADADPLYQQALALKEKLVGPNHGNLVPTLADRALLYRMQSRYADAEALYKRALDISKNIFGLNNPYTIRTLNELTSVYTEQHRYGDALPLVRASIAQKSATTASALPALFGAQTQNLLGADEAFDASLDVVQRAVQSAAGDALNALAVRFSSGTDRLADLVRKDQDLAREANGLDKRLIAAVSAAPAQRDPNAEQSIRDRITANAKERDDLGKLFAREFPDYVALSRPEPLTAKDIEPLLAADEALVVIDLGAKSYVWAITRNAAQWKELAVTADDVSTSVAALRALLNVDSPKPFDAQASFALYQKILAPVEDMLRGKSRLSLVLTGALTSLPPQVLVTRDPAGKELKDVDWLIRTQAVTVLPSIASLKVLRGKSASVVTAKPLIGFADPVFDRDPQALQQNSRIAANVAAARGIRGTVANLAQLKAALPPLPDTATELREVAATVHADPAGIILGAAATESRVKQEKLDQYRIVYFATHGLLAGEVADFAKLNAEPALVLSLPEKPTELDDGLLTASEVAQLSLNADWVVLSACNTAAPDKPGAEALSGLARAFFYAGGRSLLVSNWEVETTSTVALMTGTFAALASDPKLSHGQALQKSMLTMIDDVQHPQWADPKYWAPFVVVGEPAKPAK
jgi:CHAT domain-containing protein